MGNNTNTISKELQLQILKKCVSPEYISRYTPHLVNVPFNEIYAAMEEYAADWKLKYETLEVMLDTCGHNYEEMKSKLHLLQQEYGQLESEFDKVLHEERNKMQQKLSEQAEAFGQEYDKLKHTGEVLATGYHRLDAENKALKEKAEKMLYALQIADRYIRNDQYGEWAKEAAAIREEIRTALSFYNSQTNNQNEKKGN